MHSISGASIYEIDGCRCRFGPIVRHVLRMHHGVCCLKYMPILPFGNSILLGCVSARKFSLNAFTYCLTGSTTSDYRVHCSFFRPNFLPPIVCRLKVEKGRWILPCENGRSNCVESWSKSSRHIYTISSSSMTTLIDPRASHNSLIFKV